AVLLHLVDRFGGRDFIREITAVEIFATFVKPLTAERGCSVADVLKTEEKEAAGGVDMAAEIGKANVFVSHAWKSRFVDVVDMLVRWCAADGSGSRRKKSRLWL